jgi:nucleotide-binding universal stress UspA family protein
MKPKRILVPLDGSTLAETVLPKVIEFAREGATPVLLRAAEAHGLVGDPIVAQLEVVKEAEVYLASVAERLRHVGVQDVETCVWYGPPTEAIVEAATARDTELIVMSTHGRTGVARLVLGSVAESVLRAAHVPILLIRPNGAPVAKITAGRARPAESSRV